MRILLDEASLGWDEAWDLTVRTLAYTNHTLLPEALEKWPVELFELLLPRHLEIIYEINRRFLDDVRAALPRRRRPRRAHEPDRGGAGAAGAHGQPGDRRHAQHQRRGRDPLRAAADDTWSPTSPRCSPSGSTTRPTASRRGAGCCWPTPTWPRLITEAIGDGWVTDLAQLRRLVPLADDAALPRRVPRRPSATAKARFADWLQAGDRAGRSIPTRSSTARSSASTSTSGNCSTCCTSIVLYNRLRDEPDARRAAADVLLRRQGGAGVPPGQADHQAHQQRRPRSIDADPAVRGRLKVLFLPEYNVTLAERLIPASDVSEQISTAGYEASGTSNMKFMMNGALTVGTRDGATIEMAEEAGEENFFLFGLTAEQVAEQPRLVQPALALRARAGDAAGARPDRLGPLQPRRAGHLRADPATRC